MHEEGAAKTIASPVTMITNHRVLIATIAIMQIVWVPPLTSVEAPSPEVSKRFKSRLKHGQTTGLVATLPLDSRFLTFT